jgi:hypothetical protein
MKMWTLIQDILSTGIKILRRLIGTFLPSQNRNVSFEALLQAQGVRKIMKSYAHISAFT